MAGATVGGFGRPQQMQVGGYAPPPLTPEYRTQVAGADIAEANAKKANYEATPNMYHDPNSGNVFQWNPAKNEYSIFSTAQPYANQMGSEDDFNFASALAQVQGALPPNLAAAQMPARVQGATPADSAAAQAAEFGRAKDRIGKLGRGSLTAAQESFESRGMGGSGMEGAATRDILSDLQGQQGEVIRDQAIQNLVRQRQVEDRNYAGDINQRGQDIGFTTTTRGQDASYGLGRAQLQVPLMQLIAANRRKRLY